MRFKYIKIFIMGIFLIGFSTVTLAKSEVQTNHGKAKGKPFRYLQRQIDSLQQLMDEISERVEVLESLSFRFFDMGDGTIRDNDSGLIWLKDASCSELAGTNSDGRADWSTAQDSAAALSDGTCGLTDGSEPGDWRIADSPEWREFMSPGYTDPALEDTRGDGQWSEGDAFVGVKSDPPYWTASNLSVDWVYVAFLRDGITFVLDPFQNFYVWPVRSVSNQ